MVPSSLCLTCVLCDFLIFVLSFCSFFLPAATAAPLATAPRVGALPAIRASSGGKAVVWGPSARRRSRRCPEAVGQPLIVPPRLARMQEGADVLYNPLAGQRVCALVRPALRADVKRARLSTARGLVAHERTLRPSLRSTSLLQAL